MRKKIRALYRDFRSRHPLFFRFLSNTANRFFFIAFWLTGLLYASIIFFGVAAISMHDVIEPYRTWLHRAWSITYFLACIVTCYQYGKAVLEGWGDLSR